jgi:competence protein ComGC
MKWGRVVSTKLQQGFTALETVVVLIVTMTAMALSGQYISSYADNVSYQTTAAQATMVSNAANQYLKDNFAAVTSVATSSTPAVITVAMLESTNYLPSSFNSTNPYGQTYEILALQPVANTLNTMIVTTGGSTISEVGIRKIAQLIGATGGYISATNTAQAQGSYGGWQMALATYGVSPGAGHLAIALFFQNGALVSDYLYRNSVSGQPQLNTMNTPLVLGTSTIETSGAACSTNGAIARDSNGAVLACASGNWAYPGSKYWKDPVSTFTALPTTGNNVGDVRETLDTARTFTWTGAAWSALSVDQNGNLTVPGKVTANNVVTASGNGVQVGSAYLYGDATNSAIRQNGSFSVQNAAGTAAADINVNHANIAAVATAGTACSPNGSIAQDGTGLLLSCQSGSWARTSAVLYGGQFLL